MSEIKIQHAIFNHCEAILEDLSLFDDALLKLRFEGRQNFQKNLKTFTSILKILKNHVDIHANLEEREIFPHFYKGSPELYSIRSLFCLEHKELKDHLRHLSKFLRQTPKPIDSIFYEGTYLLGLGRSHFGLETKHFYQLLDNNLNSQSKNKLYQIIKSNF